MVRTEQNLQQWYVCQAKNSVQPAHLGSPGSKVFYANSKFCCRFCHARLSLGRIFNWHEITTLCLHTGISIKIKWKRKPDTPNLGNRLVQFARIEQSIKCKRVKYISSGRCKILWISIFDIIQLLTFVEVDMKCYWTVNFILTDAKQE